jgi:HPt (histidine-containing phosphotransfer) domain-containing protein
MTMEQARQLPVLDVEQGVARLMGNRRGYFNALKRLAAHGNAARIATTQFTEGDHAGACRTIHSLKGAAGLLCASEVHAIALEVEAALAHGAVEPALMGELEAALQRALACIDAILANEAVAPPPVAPPHAGDTRELLDRLDTLLDEGNGSAIDHVDRYGQVLAETLGAAAWRTVAAAVGDYDFERALAALRSARPAAMR